MRLDEVLTLTRPLVGIDLETTGVVIRTSAIVQLALEIMVPGQPVREYKTLVNPIMPIPPEAIAVHGIADADVKDAPTFRKLAANLHKGLVGCDFAGTEIRRFDLPLLAEEFQRAGLEWSYEDAAIIDAARLEQIVKPRKLGDLVDEWIPLGDLDELGDRQAHDALWDVRAATRVAAHQIVGGNLPRDPQALHALCYPDAYDADGKLRWLPSGYLALTFGDHRDIPLHNVPTGFLSWMLKKDFSAKVKAACRLTLNNIRIERDA